MKIKLNKLDYKIKREKWEMLLPIGKGAFADVKHSMSPSLWAHGRILLLEPLVVGWGPMTIFAQWVLSVNYIERLPHMRQTFRNFFSFSHGCWKIFLEKGCWQHRKAALSCPVVDIAYGRNKYFGGDLISAEHHPGWLIKSLNLHLS